MKPIIHSIVWQVDHIHKYTLLCSPLQNSYRLEQNGVFYILIGHAYDPFSMTYDESDILIQLSGCKDQQAFFDKIS